MFTDIINVIKKSKIALEKSHTDLADYYYEFNLKQLLKKLEKPTVITGGAASINNYFRMFLNLIENEDTKIQIFQEKNKNKNRNHNHNHNYNHDNNRKIFLMKVIKKN